MHVMPTCHFDDAGRRRLALLNDPKLLDRRPSPPPLRTRQNRNLAHVCSFACKSISQSANYRRQDCHPEGGLHRRVTLDLYADRTSAQTMRANQLRLWFASMAYVLICALRRIGLAETTFADATCGTIRLKLLKIGALVRISCRRIKIAMASACPAAEEWGRAARRLAEATKARASPA